MRIPTPTLFFTLVLATACSSARAAGPVPATGLLAITPEFGSKNACIDTPFRLTFSVPPVLVKSGTIQILDNTGTTIDFINLAAPTATKTIGGLPNFN